MHTRTALPGDFSFIMSLADRLAAGADFPWRTPEEILSFQHTFMRESLGRPTTVVRIAETEDGERLGFIAVEPLADPVTGAAGGYVSLLAVTEAAEGRGVGRILIDAAEEIARAAGWAVLALDAFSTNARGRRFYEALGFHEESVRLVRPLI